MMLHKLAPADAETSPDSYMVDQLATSIWAALEQTAIKDITTHAEILSALFTVLHRFMSVSRMHEDPADSLHNTKEVNRVLGELMLEFGSTRH